MSLIPCEACKNEISQLAVSCPKCGHPNKFVPTTSSTKNRVVTVQQTSKKYKISKLIGGLLLFIGFLAFNANPLVAAIFFIFGSFLFMYAVFGRWWNNE